MLGPNDKDIVALDGQNTDKSSGAQVKLLSQDSLSMSAEAETVETQKQKSFCRIIQIMVNTEPTRVFIENSILCRKSFLDYSIQTVKPQEYRAAVLLSAHYPKIAGHSGV